MNKIITITTLMAITCPTAYAKMNCCGKCMYNTDNDACTNNCCISKYGYASGTTSYSEPNTNGVITITTYTENVKCATSDTGTTSVYCGRDRSYTCAAGYYGTPTLFDLTCTKCATATGHGSATTAASGATVITDCYLPAGTAFSDSTGSGTYSEKCNYGL